MTAMQTEPAQTYRQPAAGDAVHFWAGDPPPLSQNYRKPPCGRALIVRVHEAEPGFTAFADLVVVTDSGAQFLYDVPRMESFAEMCGHRSYGAPGSWHVINHPEESP